MLIYIKPVFDWREPTPLLPSRLIPELCHLSCIIDHHRWFSLQHRSHLGLVDNLPKNKQHVCTPCEVYIIKLSSHVQLRQDLKVAVMNFSTKFSGVWPSHTIYLHTISADSPRDVGISERLPTSCGTFTPSARKEKYRHHHRSCINVLYTGKAPICGRPIMQRVPQQLPSKMPAVSKV